MASLSLVTLRGKTTLPHYLYRAGLGQVPKGRSVLIGFVSPPTRAGTTTLPNGARGRRRCLVSPAAAGGRQARHLPFALVNSDSARAPT